MALGARTLQRSVLSRKPLERRDPLIFSGRVGLNYPQAEDFDAWAALRTRSRALLTPWEPLWPEDELSRSAFNRRLRLYRRAIRAEDAYPFFIFRQTDGVLMGGLTLSNLKRGVTQSCSLGYWLGAPYIRQGYMTEAVRAAIRFAFTRLGLHRIEAACVPSNEASRNLLLKMGFTEEGYARSYLKINGQWQDHVLFGLLESDPWP